MQVILSLQVLIFLKRIPAIKSIQEYLLIHTNPYMHDDYKLVK